MNKFGLIGFPLEHSFSKKYYLEKIENEKLKGYDYDLYPINKLELLHELLKTENLTGINVTIPYKIEVIPYLDALTEEAQSIGAVNCIEFQKTDNKVRLIGHNTDVYGFKKSLIPLLSKGTNKALILGTGGASKAVEFALKALKIEYKLVSRTRRESILSYNELNKKLINSYNIIINTTPLGTFPNTEEFPDIPYKYITNNHICYDLIYNPTETKFLKQAKKQGAKTKNGYEMLVLQAEENWNIWTK